jgi:hypothetical protein
VTQFICNHCQDSIPGDPSKDVVDQKITWGTVYLKATNVKGEVYSRQETFHLCPECRQDLAEFLNL